MKPVLSHLNEAIEQLTKAGMESPQLDAEVLLAHALGCERHEVYCTPHPPKSWRMLRDPAKPGLDAATTGYLLPYGNLEVFKSYMERRLKNEPIAYIVGYKEFWSLKIKVTPAVLIPRPATENLVEKALEILDHGLWTVNHRPKILDLCTGSGAIAAALAKELPTANIVAADISAEALQVAKENLKFAEDRVTLVQSNLFEKITGKFDLIFSNPPYIPREVVLNLDPDITNYEPHLALDGGEDGLDFIQKIRQDAPSFLKETGWLILENGASGLKVETWNVSSLKEGSPSTALLI